MRHHDHGEVHLTCLAFSVDSSRVMELFHVLVRAPRVKPDSDGERVVRHYVRREVPLARLAFSNLFFQRPVII